MTNEGDSEAAAVETDPKTTDAAPAPGSQDGQADGSPPPEGDRTSGGDGDSAKQTDGEKALRQRLTELGEAKSNVDAILSAAMKAPGWEKIEAHITGKATAEEDDELLREIFASEDVKNPDDPGYLKAKKWASVMTERIENRILAKLGPTVRAVGESVEDKVTAKALSAEGLEPSEAFDTFREDFAAENPSYEKLRKVDATAAARWLASSFAIQQKRSNRTAVGDREDATLERGGGSSARAGGAASLVKIDRRDPQKIQKLLSAFKEGKTPVDESGRKYKTAR